VPPLLSRDLYRSTEPDAGHVFHPLASALSRARIAGRKIIEFSIRLQVGRCGTSLGAHDDGDDCASGGFSFYLNETWDPHWGGLLIAFEPVDLGPRPEPFSLAAMAKWHRGLDRTRFNHAIMPRRNRLVLLWHPIRHMVTQILPTAGDHRRIACTGYVRTLPAS
jgi:Rps23 Pro-64 3,4-dihydroxylase Tpa1-like proline 4-hydroxylase